MKMWFRVALVVVVASALVLTGVSYAHFLARKTVSHMPLWGVDLGGPGNNDRTTYDFCLPSNGLRAGTAWFYWQVNSGGSVLLVVTGPAPVNATVYNSTEFAGFGSGSFEVAIYGHTNCGSYSFRIYVVYSSEVSVIGTWNYTTAVPFI